MCVCGGGGGARGLGYRSNGFGIPDRELTGRKTSTQTLLKLEVPYK